jgi:hypothetical protein
MAVKKLRLKELISTEPLSQFFLQREWLNPSNTFLILLIIGILDEIIIGVLLGYLRSTNQVVGVLDKKNISLLLVSLVIEPSIWAFYIWFPNAAIQFFERLGQRGIIIGNQTEWKKHVEKLVSWGSSRFYKLLAILSAAILTIFAMFVIGRYQPTPWFFYVKWHFWILGLPRILASAYVAVYSVMWSIMTVITLDRIFNTTRLEVIPYHEDGAGGLAFIGIFILGMSRLALISVPFLIGETLFALYLGRGIQGQINLLAELTILPVIALAIITAPLLSCRRAMIFSKQDAIKNLREEIQRRLKISGPSITKEDLEILQTLIDFQAKLKRDFPTLPFNVEAYKQVGINFLISILPVIISIISLIIGR